MCRFSCITIPILDRVLIGCFTKKPSLFCKSVVHSPAFPLLKLFLRDRVLLKEQNN